MNTYCSIVHTKELAKVEVLISSLRKYHPDAHFSILVTGLKKKYKTKSVFHLNNCSYYFYDESYLPYAAAETYKKYKFSDKFRLAMVPVFLQMLVEIGLEKVIYFDKDTLIASPMEQVLSQLENNYTLLNVNGWPSDPNKDPIGFQRIFLDGFYNARFLCVTNGSAKALEWWSKMTLFQFEKSRRGYLYNYQNYLNVFPTLFEGVEILKDPRLGVCMENIKERELTISNESHVAFIHLTKELIQYVRNSSNDYLKTEINTYFQNLERTTLPEFV